MAHLVDHLTLFSAAAAVATITLAEKTAGQRVWEWSWPGGLERRRKIRNNIGTWSSPSQKETQVLQEEEEQVIFQLCVTERGKIKARRPVTA